MKKNAKNLFNSFLASLIVILGIGLITAGLITIFLKIFGIPYLFEGIVALALGTVCVSLAQLNIQLTKTIEISISTIDQLTDSLTNSMEFIDDITGDYPPINMKGENPIHRFDINKMSLEELEKLKVSFPHLATIFDMVRPDVMTGSSIQEYDKMSEAQLRKELKNAIEKDNFEKAAQIQKVLNKKQSDD